jgi:hypothetical protein
VSRARVEGCATLEDGLTIERRQPRDHEADRPAGNMRIESRDVHGIILCTVRDLSCDHFVPPTAEPV